MSDTSKISTSDDLHSNEVNDEPLDPRIPIELERANAATGEINNLETQLDNAQKLFQISFNNFKQHLAQLAKRLGRCVERARPYYNACKLAEEAHLETVQATQDYQNSVESHVTAKENLTLAEKKLSKSDDHTRQEYINHMTLKVTQAEKDKLHYERIHEEKSKLYQEYEQQRIKLYHSLRRTVMKSKPYFDAKFKAENELKNQKSRIEDVQNAIIKAKKTYRTALNNLEQISDEIHTKRKTQIILTLPIREPAIGAEKPESFLELPNIDFTKIDLSGDSSDNDDSNSISISKSTNCIYALSASNTLSPLTTNNPNSHLSAQTVAYVNNDNDQRKRKHIISSKNDRIRPTRMIMNTETPLLSHLFGANKFHSDPNLNIIANK